MNNKEATRISNLINSNKLQNDENSKIMVSRVNVHSMKEMGDVANILENTQPDTLIMLTAVFERLMFVAVICPSFCSSWQGINFRDKFLDGAVNSVRIEGTSLRSYTENQGISINEISYQGVSNDHDPEKLIDQVNTNAFEILRRVKLYKDPPEEKEYNFDDLEEFEN